eukprot:TRINITY_DN11357_c0_g1_i1.p2 TRINITY_DN11357_c0_g1~~TRINITY_DN11357_c0_g1_i1.p2  ORF type:complete len:81 (+),score=13.60 TRINITY_DN11357_c0_g1_i1:257-499(+)
MMEIFLRMCILKRWVQPGLQDISIREKITMQSLVSAVETLQSEIHANNVPIVVFYFASNFVKICILSNVAKSACASTKGM